MSDEQLSFILNKQLLVRLVHAMYKSKWMFFKPHHIGCYDFGYSLRWLRTCYHPGYVVAS